MVVGKQIWDSLSKDFIEASNRKTVGIKGVAGIFFMILKPK